jgi:anthranilate synthase/aminodeoxychorismate synthase-like glutamine amidotransferase
MVLVIDNYDSFTYNLVQYLGEIGASVRVARNDHITCDEIAELEPRHIVISPGPGRPENAGISMEVVRRFGPTIPTLGVCLGHQAIGASYGGAIGRAPTLMHGKTSMVSHDGRGVFAGLDGPFSAGRYHSLIVESPLPEDLEVTARTDEDVIMGLRHRRHPVHGVQFHPESILTGEGKGILGSFLDL